MRRTEVERSYGHAYLGHCLAPGSVVLDVGANRGEFCSDVVARTECHVYAIEPVPELAESIPSHPRVTVETVALTARSGAITFFASPDEYATMIDSFRRDGQVEIQTEGVSLDEFLKTRRIERVALMKIDAEGAEHEIIRGASSESLSVIDQISVEFHEFLHPSEAPEIARTASRLREAGFMQLDFSRGYWSDVLFLNKKRSALLQRGYLKARYLYWPRIRP